MRLTVDDYHAGIGAKPSQGCCGGPPWELADMDKTECAFCRGSFRGPLYPMQPLDLWAVRPGGAGWCLPYRGRVTGPILLWSTQLELEKGQLGEKADPDSTDVGRQRKMDEPTPTSRHHERLTLFICMLSFIGVRITTKNTKWRIRGSRTCVSPMMIYVSEIRTRLISQWLERLAVSDGLIKAPEKTGKQRILTQHTSRGNSSFIHWQ